MAFRQEKKKISVRENKDAMHHNNHWESPHLPSKASVTTITSEILHGPRESGTQPQTFTSSII